MGHKRKTSPDDKDARGHRIGQRGARRGQTTNPQPHGGSIGQKPYVPDERDREYVRDHCFYLGKERTAKHLGISPSTLDRHFEAEMKHANETLLEALSKTAMQRALKGDGPMVRFILATRFPELWSPKYKHEHSGPDGQPLIAEQVAKTLDPLLKDRTPDELRIVESILEALLAASGGIEVESALAPGGEAAGGEPPTIN